MYLNFICFNYSTLNNEHDWEDLCIQLMMLHHRCANAPQVLLMYRTSPTYLIHPHKLKMCSIHWASHFHATPHLFNSRNLCKKEPQLLSHCDSFDQPDLQSLNNYKFFFFVLRLQFLKCEACNIQLERYFQNLFNGILHTPKFLNFHLLNQKNQICSHLGTTY
jgi:hypothetical protein